MSIILDSLQVLAHQVNKGLQLNGSGLDQKEEGQSSSNAGSQGKWWLRSDDYYLYSGGCPPRACTHWPRPVHVRCPSESSACVPAPARVAPALYAACTTRASALAVRYPPRAVHRAHGPVRPLPHAPPCPLAVHTPRPRPTPHAPCTPPLLHAPLRPVAVHAPIPARAGSLRPPHPLVVHAPIPVPAPLPCVRGGRSERGREWAFARRAQARRVRERVQRAGVHGAGGAAVRRARGPHAVRRVRARIVHCTCRAVCVREGRAAQAGATYVRVLTALRTCARCPPPACARWGGVRDDTDIPDLVSVAMGLIKTLENEFSVGRGEKNASTTHCGIPLAVVRALRGAGRTRVQAGSGQGVRSALMSIIWWFWKRGIAEEGSAGRRRRGVAVGGRRKRWRGGACLAPQLGFGFKLRKKAVGRGRCSSQKGSGAEAVCHECTFCGATKSGRSFFVATKSGCSFLGNYVTTNMGTEPSPPPFTVT
ncbi:hypothetical protein GGX14DRAFT_408821 [Mycena pura]|uniref:Uncharacterized protein n=1 Tax=Mycena pura TaxID=153505 RepID=A0AAD6UKS6_9AGAR|nr:hypothetical protein GGX14DRAFT_408821 [Mycena pura]